MSSFPGFPAGPAPAQLPQGGPPAADPTQAAGMSPQAKMMIAQALMGGQGGGGMGAPQNGFAGGLSAGVNPMLQAMMRQKMMQQMMGGGAPAAPAMAPPMGGTPPGNIG